MYLDEDEEREKLGGVKKKEVEIMERCIQNLKICK